MRVICSGKEKIYMTTCRKCNSDLEYTEDDVFYTQEECKGGLIKTVPHLFKADEYYTNVYIQDYRCIRCPVCGNVIKSIDISKGFPSSKTERWEKKY